MVGVLLPHSANRALLLRALVPRAAAPATLQKQRSAQQQETLSEILRTTQKGSSVHTNFSFNDDDNGHNDDNNSPYPPHQQLGASSSSRHGGVLHHGDDEELLQTLSEKGQLDMALDVLSHMHAAPSHDTYMALLKACNKSKALPQAKRVHAHLTRHRTRLTRLLGGYLVMTLAKCGAIKDACHVSATLPRRTVFSWTAIISAYAERGHGQEALTMHQCMLEDGVEPNRYTFVSLFKACGNIPDLEQGKKLHSDARRKGFISDAFVGNTLVSMYGKCGAIVEAEDVFHALHQHNIVSWTAMLSAYVEQGQGGKALQLYRQMQEEGVSPDQHTLVFALQACSTISKKEEALVVDGQSSKMLCLEIGQTLHSYIRRKGFASNVFVGTALLKMYGKCGAIAEAEDVFRALSQRDTVTWNAMLSAYLEHSQGEKVLQLCTQMQMEHIIVDDATLICILQASSKAGSLEICNKLHFEIVYAGYDQILPVAATLIHAYGSCASMVDAQVIFNKLPKPDIVSWNACIAGHAGEGNFAASLHMFEKLKRTCIKPDAVTFILVLLACSHTGLVAKGLEYFESMSRDFGVSPDLKHYGIMVDLLGHSGDFKSIENMLRSMPMQADLTIWLCLLGTCCTHSNLELAKHAFDHAVNLEPKQATAYILMSKIYADAGLQEFAAEVEECREKAGAWQKPVDDWIEHEQDIHSFIDDHKHPQGKHVNQLLHHLSKVFKERRLSFTSKGILGNAA